jgi:diguanylate cyclase (GGDEF)-like protein
VAQKLHEAIAALKLEHPSAPSRFVTISIGICSSANSEMPTPTGLLRKADEALYRAKALGRNRTEFLAIDDDPV